MSRGSQKTRNHARHLRAKRKARSNWVNGGCDFCAWAHDPNSDDCGDPCDCGCHLVNEALKMVRVVGEA